LLSLAAFVNGDGLLNSNNILRKSSVVEDVKDVMEIKPNNIGEIGTREEKLPSHILTKKGYASGGGKNSKAMKKTIADALLKVGNAYVKEESEVEKFGPIDSSPLKHREGNASL
jgi:hypothetical protein